MGEMIETSQAPSAEQLMQELEQKLQIENSELKEENENAEKDLECSREDLCTRKSEVMQRIQALAAEKGSDDPEVQEMLAQFQQASDMMQPEVDDFYRTTSIDDMLRKDEDTLLGSVTSLEADENGELWHTVDFPSREASRLMGLGNMLPDEYAYVHVHTAEGKDVYGYRTLMMFQGKERVAYKNVNTGAYIKVFDGDTFQAFTEEQGAPQPEQKEESFATSSLDWNTLLENDENSFFNNLGGKSSAEINARYADEVEKDEEEAAERLAREQQFRNEKFEAYIAREFGVQDFEIGEIPEEPIIRAHLENVFEKKDYAGFNFAQAYPFFQAITQQESGGDYAAIGSLIESGTHTGYKAMGRYQIMPLNWQEWAKQDNGEILLPTPENQDIVAFTQLCKYLQSWINKGVSFDEATQLAAVNWYGNMGKTLTTNLSSISTKRPATGQPTPQEYSQQVFGRYKDFKSESYV